MKQSDIVQLDGKLAVVTGGASGIGKGIATRMIEAGAHVIIADRDDAALAGTASELGCAGRLVDVTSADSVDQLARWVEGHHGGIDILVNNAGVGPLAPFDHLTLADFRWVMDVNFWGVVHGLKSFMPALRANPTGGTIVNTISVAAFLPAVGISAYAASKAAVLAVSEALIRELEHEELERGARINVSLLVPALVQTNINVNSSKRPGYRPDGPQTELYLPPGRSLSPLQVGELVVEGIRNRRRYILTHEETRGPISGHFDLVQDLLAR